MKNYLSRAGEKIGLAILTVFAILAVACIVLTVLSGLFNPTNSSANPGDEPIAGCWQGGNC